MAHAIFWFEQPPQPHQRVRVYINAVERKDYRSIMDVMTGQLGIAFDNLSREESEMVSVIVDV